MKRKGLCFILCMFVAAVAYYSSQKYLQSHLLKGQATEQKDDEYREESRDRKEGIEAVMAVLRRETQCLTLMEKQQSDFNFRECMEKRQTLPQQEAAVVQFKTATITAQSNVGPTVFRFIEVLLILGLALQLFFFVYTVWLEKSARIDRFIYHASDWAINTPPILGVLANLLAFALLLSEGTHKIQELFNENFYKATITTIIGGFFYIINLGLKIVIQSRIDAEYR